MTILEPGCGMGFWTIDAARLVGQRGRLVAVDLQPRMLASLKRRAEKAGVMDRIEMRECTQGSLCVDDLESGVDLALALLMVHEVPDIHTFLGQLLRTLKPGGQLLLAEPIFHVTAKAFQLEIAAACEAGFTVADPVRFPSGRAVLFTRRRSG